MFNHPPGLFVLFFTEMWERFSYYGMRALLVLYMTQHLLAAADAGSLIWGFDSVKAGLEMLLGPLPGQPTLAGQQALASQIYGLYTGLAYLTPLLGGMLADSLLGARRCVILGAVLMAIGHFMMAVEAWFFPALLFLILGNGCFKPNISTQVGQLYAPGDPRRDGAFTLFYVGINLGAMLAPLVCGTLGQRYGWHFGFAAAGFGMLVGLAVFLYGQRYFPAAQIAQNREQVRSRPLTPIEWRAIIALLVLTLLNSVFWAVYEQQGNTLQLLAEHDTDRLIGDWEIPSTWFQSLNPVFILLLAPLLDSATQIMAQRGWVPSSIGKMATGTLLLGGAFLWLAWLAASQESGVKLSLPGIAGCILVLTLGELLFSPVGLSLVSKVAPAHWVSRLMGVWLLSSFLGNFLSGYLGGFYSLMPKTDFFMLLAGLAGITSFAIFTLKAPLKRAVGEV